MAAVDKPKLHLWETGVMRITRHPQMFGQVTLLSLSLTELNMSDLAAAAPCSGHVQLGPLNTAACIIGYSCKAPYRPGHA